MKPDKQEILRAVGVLFEPGSVVELRVLDASTPAYQNPHTESGYFNDWSALAEAALSIKKAKGVYVTINPVNPALLARAVNRIRPAARDPLTGDHDVVLRRWLPVDIDAKRPAGISSTDTERRAARVLAHAIKLDLGHKGWPEPIYADSGNGAHLLYRIEIPAGDGGLVERCLKAMAEGYADYTMAEVDKTPHNPARIWKLYGSVAAKGDSTPERPHRVARLLAMPETVEVVPIDKLQALAATVKPVLEPPPNGPRRNRDGHFDLDRWIAEHNLDVTGPEPWQGGRRWVFGTCPWDSTHRNRSAYIVQHASGAIGAGCHHNSCAGRDWHALRDAVEPGWRERRREAPVRGRKVYPVALPDWKAFPVEALPSSIGDYVLAAARSIGCDPAAVALPLLAALASAIGNSYRVRVKSGWTEPAVLWTGVVAESGTGKTPAARAVMAPLEKREAEAARQYAAEFADYERQKMLYEKKWAAWKRGAKGQDGEPPEAPVKPVCARYIVSDITIEALACQLAENPRGLLVHRDELAAWIWGFSQYKQQGSDLPSWLSMHSAGPVRVDRKTGEQRHVFVSSAAVSVTGGIQPKALRRILSPGFFDCGLVARLLLVMPPRQPRAWREATVPEAVSRGVAAVFHNLVTHLQPVTDEHGQSCPNEIPLSPEGKRVFAQFVNEHGREQYESTAGDLASLWSKLESAGARLALIHHLVRFAAGEQFNMDAIGPESVEAGVMLVRWFGAEARRLYRVLQETEAEQTQRELAELVARLGAEVSARDLMRANKSYTTAEAAEAALSDLAKHGFGGWHTLNTTDRGGRPTSFFRLFSPGTSDTTPVTPDETEVLSLSPPNNEPKTQIDGSPEEVMEWPG